nr:TIGR03032 family protein [Zavarzinella formosa]
MPADINECLEKAGESLRIGAFGLAGNIRSQCRPDNNDDRIMGMNHISPLASEQTSAAEPWLQVYGSAHFPEWLAGQRLSLAFTTYQAGKLLFLGLQPDGRMAVFERTFQRCMGLCGDGQTLWLSTLSQLWRFENSLAPGESYQGADKLYVPRAAHTTGDLDIHDVVVEESGRVVFVNTRFGCLATLNDRASFTPLWKPPFLSKLVPEDRCHLNGLALDNGKARFVTAVGVCDVVDGWRDKRRDGGVVIDVPSNEIIATGLSMPHSPRVYRGKLWLLNAGTGYFGSIDLAKGRFEPLTFCPGFLRGLAFAGDYAIVGLSGPRHEHNTFGGLPLDDELAKRGAEPRGGLQVIDLRTGDVAHWVRLEGMVTELYDVIALPGVVRPMALGFKTDEIQRLLTVGEAGTL